MLSPVQVLSVSTALPPHEILQRDAARAAAEQFADRFKDFDRLVRVFESSGIRKRHAVRPLEWYATPLGWRRERPRRPGGQDSKFSAANPR